MHLQEAPSAAGAPAPDSTALLCEPHLLENVRRPMIKFSILQLCDPHRAGNPARQAGIGALKPGPAWGAKAVFKTPLWTNLNNTGAATLQQHQGRVRAGSLMGDKDQAKHVKALRLTAPIFPTPGSADFLGCRRVLDGVIAVFDIDGHGQDFSGSLECPPLSERVRTVFF